MKRNGFTLIEMMVLVAVVAIVAGLGGMIIYPAFSHASESARRATCQSNPQHMSLAVFQYNQDHDQKFPLIKVKNVASSTSPFKTPYGWADAIQPYILGTVIFQCLSETDGRVSQDATQPGFTDYFYNSNLSSKRQKDMDIPVAVILFGDGNDGTERTDARYNRNSFPSSWLHDESKPTFRHLEGANYAFADGHIMWYQPSSIHQSPKPEDYSPTFKVR